MVVLVFMLAVRKLRLIRKQIQDKQVTVKSAYAVDGRQWLKRADNHTRRNMNYCKKYLHALYYSAISLEIIELYP